MCGMLLHGVEASGVGTLSRLTTPMASPPWCSRPTFIWAMLTPSSPRVLPMKPIRPGRSRWVKIKQRAVDVGVEQVRAQPHQAEELLAEEGPGGDVRLPLGRDLGLDHGAEVAGGLGRALLDLEARARAPATWR